MLKTPIQNTKVTVVGLGATGLSLVRFLHKRGARVRVVDGVEKPTGLNQLQAEYPDLEFAATDLTRGNTHEDTDWLALSPGVPRASAYVQSAIDKALPVVGDIELFAQHVAPSCDVVAVTGSNGKTTTVALTGALLKTARPDVVMAGNIGRPVLDVLDEERPVSTYALELSSFQLESTFSLRLCNAAVLNVSENHLDRYASFFDYAASKARIFDHAERQVLNRDDVWSRAMLRDRTPAVTFGTSAPTASNEAGLLQQPEGTTLAIGTESVLPVGEMKLRGAHNIQNALAALMLARTFPLEMPAVREVLRTFSGMPHRCEWLGSVTGVDIINDSKATTTVASAAALVGLSKPTWLIAGGDGKGQRFDEFAATAARFCKAVHLIGRDASQIAAALQMQGVAYRVFDQLEDATTAALEQAEAGDQVLLSPACASWDMFKSYIERAEVFARTVAAWASAQGREYVQGGRHAH